ncbi:type II toxin-antitoxin system death-on-curing family toxin [Beijerinckia sp. L45]|uniref:type II toxin-antitoxin system death-on-curing family toxin n=1 Tax=Beijerinckia sp. L45 TaxID=1641855 RepID=UPI00131D0505|nr:type II toxin-antitoxin system death-on-curing family toxin [Beijerinckia sp. L45]
MNEPVWLGVELIIDIHSEQLALFGGPAGIRDMGLLESAMARPLNRYAYGEENLDALAASYAFGLARNHPFIDGNKRAAFAAFIVFLGINGINFRVPPQHATASILALAAGEIDEAGFTRWVKENWPGAA